MTTTATPTTSSRTLLYIILGLVGLVAGLFLLVLLYFGLSYLALNLFLTLDLSAYGQVAVGGWLGYSLLGLGLGAAGGAVAAQHRYRLHQGLTWGAAGLGLLLLALVAVPGAAHVTEPTATTAADYKPAPGRVSCAACTTIAASTTYPTQNGNSYEASNLLRRDTTLAWISEADVDIHNPLLPDTQLQLTIAPLAGHQLVGLRLRNGYCKNNGVYQSFGRLNQCQVRLATGEQYDWMLPDSQRQEFLLPITATSHDTTKLTLTVTSIYPGENHHQVALAWLVPVFDSKKQ